MVRPGDLTGHSDFHLFKEGIKPMWEVSPDRCCSRKETGDDHKKDAEAELRGVDGSVIGLTGYTYICLFFICC